MQYIMNHATYKYPKPGVARLRIGRVLGFGLVAAEGRLTYHSLSLRRYSKSSPWVFFQPGC
jgi:hypothetical protein